MPEEKHYSEYRHPFFDSNVEKWKYAQKVYDCTAYNTGNITGFLPQKEQRETDDAYSERQTLLDPQMHFATGIDSLVGIMSDADEDADRQWQAKESTQGLGDPDDKTSIAFKLMRNADGDNTNWNFIPKQVAIKLSLKKYLWGLVDGRPKDEAGNSVGEASVKIIDPESVVNWFEENGRLTWVLVKEKRDTRESFKDDPALQEVFTEYGIQGWRRYTIDDDGVESEIGSGEYAYYLTPEKNESQRILPIYPIEIPLPRNPGYNWARKSNAIQNFESRLDFAHMSITFALLQIAIDNDNWEDFKKNFKNGLSVLNVHPDSSRDHKFLEQDSSYFEASESRLAKKVEDFYKNMFKDYGDASAQRTAQEIRLESKSGIEAYLALLVGAIDEFENQALWRISQVYFPNTPNVWGDAHVERKADFSPKDIDATIDRLVNRYIPGGTVPLTVDGLVDVIKRITSMDNIDLGEVSDNDIQALARQIVDRQSQEADLTGATLGGFN